MRTVYFCTEREFPRGDAGANRILHMAKALQMQNWDTKVISLGHAKPEHWNNSLQCYLYQDVKYSVFPDYFAGKIGRIIRRLNSGRKCVEFLKQNKIGENDVVIVYSSSYGFCKPIYKYVHSDTKSQIIFDVVEWHQPFQFNTLSTRYIYKSFNKCFTELYPANRKVIVISELLKQHFAGCGCEVLKYPIYITPDTSCAKGSGVQGKLQLIYPGNPYQKDSLLTMLEGLDLLNRNEKNKVVLHLTGTRKTVLYMSIPGNEKMLEKLIAEGVVRIHEWMEYDELMKLYDSIDFAYIARPDNIVTQANFPSKVPELLNRGIPPIITNVGDISEYLTDGYDSIVMKDCTKESCVYAIRQCLKMNAAEISQFHLNAKNSAQNVFDFKKHAQEISDFLYAIKS